MSRLFSSLGVLSSLLGLILFFTPAIGTGLLLILFAIIFGLISQFLSKWAKETKETVAVGEEVEPPSKIPEHLQWKDTDKRTGQEMVDAENKKRWQPYFDISGKPMHEQESWFERKLEEWDEKELDDLIYQAKLKGVYDDIMKEISKAADEIEEKEGRHLEIKEAIEIFKQLLQSN